MFHLFKHLLGTLGSQRCCGRYHCGRCGAPTPAWHRQTHTTGGYGHVYKLDNDVCRARANWTVWDKQKFVRWKGTGTRYQRDHRSVNITGPSRNRDRVMWPPHREGQAGKGQEQGGGRGEPLGVITTAEGSSRHASH